MGEYDTTIEYSRAVLVEPATCNEKSEAVWFLLNSMYQKKAKKVLIDPELEERTHPAARKLAMCSATHLGESDDEMEQLRELTNSGAIETDEELRTWVSEVRARSSRPRRKRFWPFN